MGYNLLYNNKMSYCKINKITITTIAIIFCLIITVTCNQSTMDRHLVNMGSNDTNSNNISWVNTNFVEGGFTGIIFFFTALIGLMAMIGIQAPVSFPKENLV